MSKADLQYKSIIEDINKNGVWDKGDNVRTVYADGSPAYTKSVFGRQVIFEEGEIPLLTSKHVGWKTAFKEMYMFWIRQTVKKEDFEKENITIWDEWFLENNTLGKSYAYQFESRPKKEIVKVKRKEMKHHGELRNVIVMDRLEPNSNNEHEYVGKVFKSKNCGDFIVLDVSVPVKENNYGRFCTIQFLDTNYVTTCNIREIKTNLMIKDYFSRSVYNVGYLGHSNNIKLFTEKEFKHLKNVWVNMISRCYNEKDVNYHNYGKVGMFVDERWHSLENFLIDMSSIPQFFLAKEEGFKNWNLDKDYYGSNCYSKETCVWLTRNDNILYAKMNSPFILYHADNTEELCISITDTAIKYGIARGNLANILRGGKNKTLKGMTAKYIDKDSKILYRYKISKNQVVDLINNIKNNPQSRRLMSSFWNDADVSEKALQECAMQTTWNVREGKLDLLLYSRSVDSALGLPYNWIQYWFLLQMVAQATGYKAGRFIHQMGNVHYYDRHEELLLKQINGENHNEPIFKINNSVKDFFSFSIDDIAIENYKNNGKFNYEVAI